MSDPGKLYRDLVRETTRAVLIGTSLSVLPAIPFYIYAFEATTDQLVVLVPLFIPALAAMLTSDLLVMRQYLKPIRKFTESLQSSVPLSDENLYLAKRRALNYPAFSVARVFLPHAVIGSGVYNLLVIVANWKLHLGLDSANFPLYWIINLTVVPVAHAVYEYFALSKAVTHTLAALDARVRALPPEHQHRVVNVRLATKVTVIFSMVGLAPLIILGISLNLRHSSLQIEKAREYLLEETRSIASLLSETEAERLLRSYSSSDRILLLRDSLGQVHVLGKILTKAQRELLNDFLTRATADSQVYPQEGLIAVKTVSPNNYVIGMATSTDALVHELTALRYGTVVIILVSFLLMVALLILVGRDINQSTTRLVSALKEVEEGSFDHDVKLYTTDEFSVIGDGFNSMLAGLRERNFIKNTFGKYVAPAIVEKILGEVRDHSDTEFRLAGERRVVTILFSDLRDFTRRTEASRAEEVVELLNRYYERMVAIVDRYDGTVDKFIGDALMVLFGAPLARPDDADRAVQAAFEMRKELKRLNDELKAQKQLPLRFGIGIHTGEVISGNIGSPNRLEYTVVGDAVNLASRIEGLTKVFKTDLLISEATVHALGNTYALKKLRSVRVKGKKKAIVVYKVFDSQGERKRKEQR